MGKNSTTLAKNLLELVGLNLAVEGLTVGPVNAQVSVHLVGMDTP